jgi:hypothetical protein
MSRCSAPLRCGGTRLAPCGAQFWICEFEATMEPGFNLIKLRRKHTPCEKAKRKTRKRRAHPRPFRKRDGPTDGPLLDISNRHAVFGVFLRNLDGPPADFQPGGERVESDVHVFFRDAGNVEFGGNLSGQKRGSKCRLSRSASIVATLSPWCHRGNP